MKQAKTLIEGLKGILKAPDFRELIQFQYMIEQHTGQHLDPDEIQAGVDKIEEKLDEDATTE